MGCEKYGLGIIGAGGIMQSHTAALKQNPQFHLTGVCSVNPEELKKWSEELGVRGYPDYRDMLATGGFDVIAVCLPHHLHCQVAVDAMKAGANVMIEKPMAITMEEINLILETGKQTGRSIIVTDSAYTRSTYVRAAELIRQGVLGRFLFGNIMNHRHYLTENRPEWYLKARTSGGGQFSNIGVHRIAAARRILGDELEEKSVTASIHWIHPEHDIETAAKVLVRYRTGEGMGYEECGGHVRPERFKNEMHFVFEKGMVAVIDGKLWISDGKGNVTDCEVAKQGSGDHYALIYGEMLKAMQGKSHYPTAQHGARDARIALAAYASARSGDTVDLDNEEWRI